MNSEKLYEENLYFFSTIVMLNQLLSLSSINTNINI